MKSVGVGVRERECTLTNPVLTTTQRSGLLILVIGNYGWGETKALDRGPVPIFHSCADAWPQLTLSPTCQLQYKQGSVAPAQALCGKPFYCHSSTQHPRQTTSGEQRSGWGGAPVTATYPTIACHDSNPGALKPRSSSASFSGVGAPFSLSPMCTKWSQLFCFEE